MARTELKPDACPICGAGKEAWKEPGGWGWYQGNSPAATYQRLVEELECMERRFCLADARVRSLTKLFVAFADQLEIMVRELRAAASDPRAEREKE